MTYIPQRRSRLAELAEMPVATHGEAWAREREAEAREIEEIKRRADAENISAMAWKQRAIRAALQPPAGSP